jgi:hypothetical protein
MPVLRPWSPFVEPLGSDADAVNVTEQETLPASGVDRAALAFSLLPTSAAEVVNRRLSISERVRLREALSRNHNAPDEHRVIAMKMLAHAVRRGVEWPRPSAHDERDCPFTVLGSHPTTQVVDVLDRIAVREPLEVAVALCHLSDEVREGIWSNLSSDTRSSVLPELDYVHNVSLTRTRMFARDLDERLSREIRQGHRLGLG